ncbi:MAG: AraC family transcriptional regulator [Eubacterium sp.]|nr:AraC family transcriptional regulator [Eubacterium sp.]
MDYETYLQKAFKPGMMVNTELTLSQLFQHYYKYEEAEGLENPRPQQATEQYLHVLARGDVSVEFPFSLRLQLTSEMIILRCQEGGVRVQEGRKNWQVSAGQYIVCPSASFAVHSMLLPCRYQILAAGGEELIMYRKLIGTGILSESADIPALDVYFSRIGKIPDQVDQKSFLQMHQALCDLFTSVCTWITDENHESSGNIPAYLQEMHDVILHHPERSFSLQVLEQQYHINRYRLCREYAGIYGIPPLHDCNRNRIGQAEKLLLTTDLQVQEISRRCGFENVNHFINLFRRNTGMTPGQFRKKARADLL